MSSTKEYICRYCGQIGGDMLGMTSCLRSPTGKHVIKPNREPYVCKFCGTTFRNPFGVVGACPSSPNGHHELMDV